MVAGNASGSMLIAAVSIIAGLWLLAALLWSQWGKYHDYTETRRRLGIGKRYKPLTKR